MQLPKGSGWPWRWMKKKSKTGEDSSYHTAHIDLGDRGRKKSKKRNGFDLDFIWISFGFHLDFIWIETKTIFLSNELTRPVMGTIFLVYIVTKIQAHSSKLKSSPPNLSEGGSVRSPTIIIIIIIIIMITIIIIIIIIITIIIIMIITIIIIIIIKLVTIITIITIC